MQIEVCSIVTWVSVLIIFLLVVIDQLSKVIIQLWLEPIGTADFIPKLVQFTYAENTGAAFGMLQSARWFFISVTAIACAVMLAMLVMKKVKPGVVQAAFVLICAGGIGNLIDRVFRGYVIDFIEPIFIDFAIFNFADSLVSVGAVLWLGYMVYDMIKDAKEQKAKKAQSAASVDVGTADE